MRIIQDSDDDLDEDLEGDAPPPKQLNASDTQLLHAPSQKGTGSTESLKRALQKAHRTHLQFQPSQNELCSSESLPKHSSRGRETAVDGTQHRSSDVICLPEKGDSITYEKMSKSIFSSPFTDSEGNQAGNNGAEYDHAPCREVGLNFKGALQDSYPLHDPMATFAEPSSTVPNATLTQQQMMDAAKAPAIVDGAPGTEEPPYQPPPEPSIPWSDLMKFSSTSTGQQTQASGRGQFTPEVATAAPLEALPKDQEAPGSQRSERTDEVHLEGSPLPHGGHPIDVHHRKKREVAENTPSRRKTQAPLTLSSDDDLLAAIGLPEERYNPRPSRSRSLMHRVEQPIDYSIRPEKAKRVSKRRRTTASTSDASAITTPQKIQQICDMGFTPSTTQRALKHNNGDVTQTVNWLINNHIGEDELALQNTPKKRTALRDVNSDPTRDVDRSQVIMHEDMGERSCADEILLKSIEAPTLLAPTNNSEHSTADVPSTTAHTKSPKVQVVIPKKSSDTGTITSVSRENPHKKPKRRKTTSDLIEHETVLEQRIASEFPPGKKTNKDRPKKATDLPSTKTMREVPEETILIDQFTEVLQSNEPNLNSAPQIPIDVPVAIEADGVQMQEPSGEAAASSALPKYTVLRATEIPTEPSSRSAMSKGKVPYRVGLSKRVRIAPLLRTLKK